MPTKQETFDKVARHLLKQGKKAEAYSGRCLYRAPDGLMCAAGPLIPDDRYDPAFEGTGIHLGSSPESETPVTKLMRELGHDVELCNALQHVHDSFLPENWASQLREVARKYALCTAIVDALSPVAAPKKSSGRPWEALEQTKTAFTAGKFILPASCASVHVTEINAYHVSIGFGSTKPSTQTFGQKDLRELAEFFTALADQLAA